MAIDFNGFSLSTDNYIVTDLVYRTIPTRNIILQNISRKPGQKLTSSEFAQKEIKLAGWIIGTDYNDLIVKIDDLNTNVSRVSMGVLTIDPNRSIKAIVNSMGITDPHYTQSATPFDLDLLAVDSPFWFGPQQSVSLVVASGNNTSKTQSFNITISGSVFAEPTITYQAPGSTGQTTTSGIIIQYGPTQETVTWSGGANTLSYGSLVTFDYSNLLILQDSTQVVAAGAFSRWETNTATVNVTFSGGVQGGNINFSYNPRYL